MKLRNKQTGEIVELAGITFINGRTFVQFNDWKGTFKFEARSLAEFNEEWEDAPKLKIHWYIYGVTPLEVDDENWDKEFINELKNTGNYFETKEEAEQAVKKLRAWKRLKDKGFKFEWWISKPEGNEIDFYLDEFEWSGQVKDDLDLLFGNNKE